MSLSKDELLDLKEKIDTTKTTLSEYTGQLQGMMKSLKDDFGCKTLEEAKIKLASIEKNIEILQKKINVGTLELENQLNEKE
jgi:hypothetical protein